jgi:hypothetical protein
MPTSVSPLSLFGSGGRVGAENQSKKLSIVADLVDLKTLWLTFVLTNNYCGRLLEAGGLRGR